MQLGQCYCFSLLFIIMLKCVHTLDKMPDSKYQEQAVCHAQDLIDKGCFTQEPNSRSRIGCFLACSLSSACLSVLIYSPGDACYLGGSCNHNPLCAPKDSNFRYYGKVAEKTTSEVPTTEPPTTTTQTTEPPTTTKQTTEPPLCEHNGVLSVEDDCDCRSTGGYIGDRCERAATSCLDLYDNNYASGTHALNIDLLGDGSVFFRTTCHLREWYSTQASFDIMRSTGSFDSDLSYNDYVSGFRFGPDDYWIGLENLHKFTADGRNHKVSKI